MNARARTYVRRRREKVSFNRLCEPATRKRRYALRKRVGAPRIALCTQIDADTNATVISSERSSVAVGRINAK